MAHTLSLQLAAAAFQEFELPGLGSVGGFSGNRKSKEFFFSFTSTCFALSMHCLQLALQYGTLLLLTSSRCPQLHTVAAAAQAAKISWSCGLDAEELALNNLISCCCGYTV